MILVDTSVLIDLFRGVNNDAVCSLKDIIKQEAPFGISSVIYQEILQGAKNKKEFNTLHEYLSTQRFFNPKDTVNSYTKAAKIYFRCRKQGITIRSTIDCLIAQIAIEHSLVLLHNDKDFIAMASLTKLQLYPAGK